jgi:hypothetical protein
MVGRIIGAKVDVHRMFGGPVEVIERINSPKQLYALLSVVAGGCVLFVLLAYCLLCFVGASTGEQMRESNSQRR